MKTKTKKIIKTGVKKIKAIKPVEAVKPEKKVKEIKKITPELLAAQTTLEKKGAEKNIIRLNSRSIYAVAYFQKNTPVADKIYSADVILSGNNSSLPYIGSGTRKNLLLAFPQFSSIIGIEKKEGNANLFKTFKFSLRGEKK